MNIFAKRLRELRKIKKLSQKELAEEIGIARTTIANYEKDLRFPNQKILNKIADFFNVSLDYLFGRSDVINSNILFSQKNNMNYFCKGNLDNIFDSFFDFIINSNHKKAYFLLYNCKMKGRSLDNMFSKILIPAIKKTNEFYCSNKINLAEKNYIFNTIENIINQISPLYFTNKKRPQKILIANVEGEFHSFAIQLLSNLLETKGYQIFYLGENTPSNCIFQTVTKYDINFLLLSVTMFYNIKTAKNIINMLENKSVKIIVGGFVFDNQKNLWKKIGADYYKKDINETVKLIEKTTK